MIINQVAVWFDIFCKHQAFPAKARSFRVQKRALFELQCNEANLGFTAAKNYCPCWIITTITIIMMIIMAIIIIIITTSIILTLIITDRIIIAAVFDFKVTAKLKNSYKSYKKAPWLKSVCSNDKIWVTTVSKAKTYHLSNRVAIFRSRSFLKQSHLIIVYGSGEIWISEWMNEYWSTYK